MKRKCTGWAIVTTVERPDGTWYDETITDMILKIEEGKNQKKWKIWVKVEDEEENHLQSFRYAS